MERAFLPEMDFKSFSVLVWCDGAELAEYKVFFWHSGIQLYLENLGYDIILWLAALATISPEIYEAARVDGASESQCFFRITMPNLWSSLFLILTLSLINGFKVFREAYLIAGDYPEQHIYLLQHLFNNWFRDLSVNKLAAGAVLMGLVLFVLIMVFQKLFDRTMS
ncbi:MAG: carbohydrate ABC transporter permease [Eubacterium ramulus]